MMELRVELMFDKMAFYFSKASDFRNIPISVSCGTVDKLLFAIAERMVNRAIKLINLEQETIIIACDDDLTTLRPYHSLLNVAVV